MIKLIRSVCYSHIVGTLMSKSTNSFYAVKVGRAPGIFSTWSECEAQVKGFPKCRYKKFSTKEEAQAFIKGPNGKASVKDSATTNVEKRKYSFTKETAEGVTAKRVALNVDKDCFTGTAFPDSEGISVYTDGGCFNNGTQEARAGIGVYWGYGEPDNVSESLPGRPTNNRAEIHAAVKAIEQAKKKGVKNLILHTDSQFLIKGITKWIKRWKKNNWTLASGNSVINKEDFITLDNSLKGINVKWVHVKGHSGDPSNDAVDLLAKEGAAKPLRR